MSVLPAVVIDSAIVVAIFWWGLTGAEAYDDCQAWAAFVETASKADDDKRARQFAAWKRLTDDRRKLQTITRAQAYLLSGGTPNDAWRRCAGY